MSIDEMKLMRERVMKAYESALSGQSWTVGRDSFQKQHIDSLLKQIQHWDKQIAIAEGRWRSPRAYRVVPMND